MSERKLSGDENLWCREFEDGPVDDPEDFSVPEKAFVWTQRCDDATPIKLTLHFENGNLVSIDENKLPLIDAVALLNKEVGKFGHGRFVGLEPLSTDDKVLEVREAPAAAIIMDALRHLEIATLDSSTLELKQSLEQRWVREAVSGQWGSKTHTMCDAAIASALDGVSGKVTYNIDQKRFLPCSIVAQNPRYVRNRDEWEHKRSLLLYGKPYSKPTLESTRTAHEEITPSTTPELVGSSTVPGLSSKIPNNILVSEISI